MKRACALLLLVILTVALATNALASENGITEIISENYKTSRKYLKENFADSGYHEQVVMRVFHDNGTDFKYYIENSLDELLESDLYLLRDYTTIEENPSYFEIEENRDNKKIHVSEIVDFDYTPTYMRDIMNSSIYNSKLLKKDEQIKSVICFDGYQHNAHDENNTGIFLFYLTGSNDGIVACYDGYSADPTEFRLNDFAELSAEYQNYFKENIYMPPDEFVYGTKAFTVFNYIELVENGEVESAFFNQYNQSESESSTGTDTSADAEESSKTNTDDTSAEDNSNTVLIISVCAVAVLVIAVIFIVKKKRS